MMSVSGQMFSIGKPSNLLKTAHMTVFSAHEKIHVKNVCCSNNKTKRSIMQALRGCITYTVFTARKMIRRDA